MALGWSVMAFDINIFYFGKRKNYYTDLLIQYRRRLLPSISMNVRPLKAPPYSDEQLVLKYENEIAAKVYPKRGFVVALDDGGKMMDSGQFAKWLQALREREQEITFFVGGAFGLPPHIKENSNESISLSKMTLPHQLCLVVLSEQIYRAITIFNNHPYNK
jgi:23S rRNA (pseudouridine1915-N3)-methyltransferase